MANTTFNLELKGTANSKGEFPIFLRITKNRKSKRVKTGESIYIPLNDEEKLSAEKINKYWDKKKQRATSRVHNQKTVNANLDEFLKNVKAKYNEDANHSTSLDGFKASLNDKGGEVILLDFIYEQIENEKNRLDIKYCKSNLAFANKLSDFLTRERKSGIFVREVTSKFLHDFYTYLNTLTNQRHPDKKLHPNYVTRTMKRFLKYLKIGEEMDLINETPKFKCPQYKPTEKTKLNYDDIKKIEVLTLSDSPSLNDTRNAFLFSYFCGGIRIGDLIQLKWSNIIDEGNGLRIQYSMGKTGRKKDLILVPRAIEILNTYRHTESIDKSIFIFPFLQKHQHEKWCEQGIKKETMQVALKELKDKRITSATAMFNKNLKRIAEISGINKTITSHIARHSFASGAGNLGLSAIGIKNVLGHTNLSTTQRYMENWNHDAEDNVLITMFGNNHSSNIESIISQIQKCTEEEKQQILNFFEKNIVKG